MKSKVVTLAVMLFALVSAGLLLPRGASAHCDTMDGPVVKMSQEALHTGNLNPVLAWVADKDVPEVRTAFEKARAAASLSSEEKTKAETFFFETVVRVHRASEGAPYTGLKPAGTDLGPVVPRADAALEKGSADEITTMVANKVQEGIRDRFNDVAAKQNYDKNDVAAGREYVESYVKYMHYVEGLYDLAENPGSDHHAEGAAPVEHHEAVATSPELHTMSEVAQGAPAEMPHTGGGANEGGWVMLALGAMSLVGLGLGAKAVRLRLDR